MPNLSESHGKANLAGRRFRIFCEMRGWAPQSQVHLLKLSRVKLISVRRTLPETNGKFALENRPFNAPKGKDRIPTIHFQVLWLLVSGRVLVDSCAPINIVSLEAFSVFTIINF